MNYETCNTNIYQISILSYSFCRFVYTLYNVRNYVFSQISSVKYYVRVTSKNNFALSYKILTLKGHI